MTTLRILWLPNHHPEFSKRATSERIPSGMCAKLNTRTWRDHGPYQLEFRNCCLDLSTGRVWAKWTGRFRFFGERAVNAIDAPNEPARIIQFPIQPKIRKAA